MDRIDHHTAAVARLPNRRAVMMVKQQHTLADDSE